MHTHCLSSPVGCGCSRSPSLVACSNGYKTPHHCRSVVPPPATVMTTTTPSSAGPVYWGQPIKFFSYSLIFFCLQLQCCTVTMTTTTMYWHQLARYASFFILLSFSFLFTTALPWWQQQQQPSALWLQCINTNFNWPPFPSPSRLIVIHVVDRHYNIWFLCSLYW